MSGVSCDSFCWSIFSGTSTWLASDMAVTISLRRLIPMSFTRLDPHEGNYIIIVYAYIYIYMCVCVCVRAHCHLIPLTCSLGCFTKHFIEKVGYKMVLRQLTSRQQVGTLYEMTSPSSLWNASPQTTRVQRQGNKPVILYKMLLQSRCCLQSAAPIWQDMSIKCLFHRRLLSHLIWFIGAATCNLFDYSDYSMYRPVYAGNTR